MKLTECIGTKGEYKVAQIFTGHLGKSVVRRNSYDHAFDLNVCGRNIEVKTCFPLKRGGMTGWKANIHRHNKIKKEPDYFIIRLEKVPEMKYAVHLLVPGDCKAKTLGFTMRSLANGDFKYALKFKEFIEECKAELAARKEVKP